MARASSAKSTWALELALICLFLSHLEIIESKEYVVGDASGWTFEVVYWPNGKQFFAGDALVFNYDPEFHNVVVVDAAGFLSCNPGSNSKTYQSGNDRITLEKGANYFICSFPGHCLLNTKIQVNAA